MQLCFLILYFLTVIAPHHLCRFPGFWTSCTRNKNCTSFSNFSTSTSNDTWKQAIKIVRPLLPRLLRSVSLLLGPLFFSPPFSIGNCRLLKRVTVTRSGREKIVFYVDMECHYVALVMFFLSPYDHRWLLPFQLYAAVAIYCYVAKNNTPMT